MSLYTITTQYQRLIDLIESGEIPEEAIADTKEAVEGEWNERADAVISAIKNLYSEADAIKSEIDSLEARRKDKLTAVGRLEKYITTSLDAVGKTRFENSRHLVRFTSSSSVAISDTAAFCGWARENLPGAVKIKVDMQPDKSFIKEALKTGDIPFCSINHKKNIQIK